MENKFYIAKDECGDVFIFNNKPNLYLGMPGKEPTHFWSSNGDEEKIYDNITGYTIFGRLINTQEDLINNLLWSDEPVEISIDIKKK